MPTLRLSDGELISLSILAAIGSTVASSSEIHDYLEEANKIVIELDDEKADYFRHQLGMLATGLLALEQPTKNMGEFTEKQLENSARRARDLGMTANESMMKAAVAIFDRLGANTNLDKGPKP